MGAPGQCARSFAAFCSMSSFTCVSMSTRVSGHCVSASSQSAATMWLFPAPVGRTRHGFPTPPSRNQA